MFLSDLRDLFHLCSRKEYDYELTKMCKKWSAVFLEYYNNNISGGFRGVARGAVAPPLPAISGNIKE